MKCMYATANRIWNACNVKWIYIQTINMIPGRISPDANMKRTEKFSRSPSYLRPLGYVSLGSFPQTDTPWVAYNLIEYITFCLQRSRVAVWYPR